MIKLNMGSVVDKESIQVSDSFTKDAISESRWRPGYATISGKLVSVERWKTLGGFEYRIGESILKAESIEAWYPSEYISWRDD